MNNHLNETVQTLCEPLSSGSAVQGTEDYVTPSKVADSCQLPLFEGYIALTDNHKQLRTISLYGHPGHEAVIDEADSALISCYRWRAFDNHGKSWYAMSSTGIFMHRLILGIHELGREIECDHIDGNGLNNVRSNLRATSRSVNMQNRNGYGSTSTFKGVVLSDNGKRWKARIYHNGKPILLGTHDTEEQAAMAYDKAALALFGSQCRLNFPHPTAAAAA